MKEKEIQTLCAKYSNSRPADEMPSNPGFCAMIASDFYKWLSERYCLVEKSKVEEAMKYPQRHTELIRGTMHFQTLGIKKVLTELFGSELFTDTDQ